MNKSIRLLIIAAVLICGSTVAPALDISLTFVKHVEEPQDVQASGYAQMKPALKPPAGEWKLPELNGEKPLYFTLKLGDLSYLMIADRSNPKDSFYSRLRLDANANSDLTDDPAVNVEWQDNEGFARLSSDIVELTIQVDGKPTPFAFSAQINSYNRQMVKQNELTEQNLDEFINNSYLRTKCMYQGEFELGGKKYRVMLGDPNCSGRFDNRMTLDPTRDERLLYPEGDNLYLADGNEKFQYQGRFILGDWLLIGGTMYEVAVNTPESKMTLTPSTVVLAPLKLSMESQFFTLYSKDGAHNLMMYEPGRETKAPAGEYRILDYFATRQDAKASLWGLYARGSVNTPFTKVADGGTASLTFGEPFVPWVDVPRWSRENFANGGMDEVQLSLEIEGSAKEFVDGLSRISGRTSEIPMSVKNNSLPKEPVYKIVKPDGEVASQGNFEYG